jgi:hypothetical protein
VALRTCRVTCRDLKDVEYAVKVTADSLYEAIAQALRTFRGADWVDEIGHGQTTITVVVKQPEVEHKVRVRDFEIWLESVGRTPAEMSLKGRLPTSGQIAASAKCPRFARRRVSEFSG